VTISEGIQNTAFCQ